MAIAQKAGPETGQEQPVVKASRWGPFGQPVYRAVWIATVVSNIGGWMYDAAASWQMTILNPDPLWVSFVQAAASLPLFLFGLPAGALADIVDKRRLLLVLEVLIAVFSALFASLMTADLVTPIILLFFVILTGAFSALEAPAWQSIVPQLVSSENLAGAVAANSVGVNISRAVGPALAGVIIVGLGIAAPFWIDAVSNFGVIGVLLWWRPMRHQVSGLPAERFASALRTGLRYAFNNKALQATLLRAVGFFIFASAYWALLPLVARSQIAGGPELYGILLGAIGVGAVGFSVFLVQVKAKIGADGIVVAGQIGTAFALVLFGLAREPVLGVCASLIAGMSWIAVLANLNVSAQVALPDWVRGRGLALYVTVFFGAMTVGSLVWGEVGGITGLPVAQFIAAAGALLAIPLMGRWKLQGAVGLDLSPSMHWPPPIVAGSVEGDAGPVMVTIEYLVLSKEREAFLAAVEKLARERKRDGAYAWGIFQDTSSTSRFVETFLVESWLEHLRQHERVTKADRLLQDEIHGHLAELPIVRHFVATAAGNEPIATLQPLAGVVGGNAAT